MIFLKWQVKDKRIWLFSGGKNRTRNYERKACILCLSNIILLAWPFLEQWQKPYLSPLPTPVMFGDSLLLPLERLFGAFLYQALPRLKISPHF